MADAPPFRCERGELRDQPAPGDFDLVLTATPGTASHRRAHSTGPRSPALQAARPALLRRRCGHDGTVAASPPRKEERVLARFQQTPAAAPDDNQRSWRARPTTASSRPIASRRARDADARRARGRFARRSSHGRDMRRASSDVLSDRRAGGRPAPALHRSNSRRARFGAAGPAHRPRAVQCRCPEKAGTATAPSLQA